MHGKTLAAALALAIVSASPVCAGDFDAYIGAFGGYGGQTRAKPFSDRSYSYDAESLDSAFYGAYVGAGWRMLAVEGGWLSLPHEHAAAHGLNPDRDSSSTLRGSALFARALLRAPSDWTARPYVFGGAARLKVANHEMSDCAVLGPEPVCAPGVHADFQETVTATRPYIGAGAELAVAGPLSLRAEFGYIPRAVVSPHIAKRDLYLGSLAAQVRF